MAKSGRRFYDRMHDLDSQDRLCGTTGGGARRGLPARWNNGWRRHPNAHNSNSNSNSYRDCYCHSYGYTHGYGKTYTDPEDRPDAEAAPDSATSTLEVRK